jgi:hypothetical protein
VVRTGEVDHLKYEHVSVVIVEVSEGDWQGDTPEGVLALIKHQFHALTS